MGEQLYRTGLGVAYCAVDNYTGDWVGGYRLELKRWTIIQETGQTLELQGWGQLYRSGR